jgi:hypothetical protein
MTPAAGKNPGWFGANIRSPTVQPAFDEFGDAVTSEEANNENREMCPSKSGNGQNALASIFSSALRIPNRSIKSISLILNSTSVKLTDPNTFTAFKQEIASADGICERWYKDATFRAAADKFTEQLKKTNGYALRTELEGFLSFIINQKDASIELATQSMIFFGTRSIRSRATTAAFQADPRASQLMEYCESYLLVPHNHLPWFEEQAIEQGDFDDSAYLPETESGNRIALDDADLADIPGFVRLTTADADARAQTWTHFVVHLIHTLCGKMQKNSIDIQACRSMLFIPTKITEEVHPLKQLVLENGELQPITVVLKAESAVMRHLDQVESILQTGQLQVSTLTRIKNLLFKGFHPDLKAAFMELFRLSGGEHEIIDDCPFMPMEQFKQLSIAAGLSAARDLEKLKIRRDVLKTSKKTPPANNTTGNNNTQQQQQGKPTKCAICRKTEHETKSCPQRTGQECTFYARFGHCKFGTNCRNDHKPKTGNPTVSPAPATQSPAVNTTGADSNQQTSDAQSTPEEMIEIECTHLLAGCTGKFQESKQKWDKLLEANPDWVLPKGCLSCRALKKQQASTAWRSPDTATGLVTTEEAAETDDDDVDDSVLTSYYSTMMTLTDTDEAYDRIVDTDSDDSSEELTDAQLQEQLEFQARRARATNTTVPAMTREALELRQDIQQPLHSKRISIDTHTFARQYAQDIMQVQSRTILDDSFEMHGAYEDSDVGNASMELSSMSISPAEQHKHTATTGRITDYFQSKQIQPTKLAFETDSLICCDPLPLTQQSQRDVNKDYSFVTNLPAEITHYYPDDCIMSPVHAQPEEPSDSEDDKPICVLFPALQTNEDFH